MILRSLWQCAGVILPAMPAPGSADGVVRAQGARLSLTCVVECGDPNLTELVDRQGAVATWTQLVDGRFGAPLAQRGAAVDIDGVTRQAKDATIRFVIPEDEEWPSTLGDLRHCPPA